MLKHIDAGALNVGYMETGVMDGWPVLLLHGFPYDVHSFDDVAPLLAARGARAFVPSLRGFGPTRFLLTETIRSGEQAALAEDVLALLDALRIPQALLAGYDWGGRAACIADALWPDRVRGLVTQNGYNIQNIAAAAAPQPPEMEHRLWYQYYFHGERGRAGLAQNRGSLCRLCWQLWSPSWAFKDADYEQSATAFDNPDFVDVVIHSYRHRFGLAAGDPLHAPTERRLARQPPITVPAISLDGADDGVRSPDGSSGHAPHFTGRYDYRLIPKAGHNVPQEAPATFADAILTVHHWTLD